jgi:hypothetical protein
VIFYLAEVSDLLQKVFIRQGLAIHFDNDFAFRKLPLDPGDNASHNHAFS